MSRKKAIKSEAASFVANSIEEADNAIAEIGRQQRDLQVQEALMNEELSIVKTKHEDLAKACAAVIRAMYDGVKVWAEANRKTLTNYHKVKTVKLGSGEVRWRTNPPSVECRDVKKILEQLKQLDADRFVRRKEEINKDAILEAGADAMKDVKGLKIKQHEEFVVVPFETSLEAVQS